ncbi:cytochrome P450 [Xylariomycetidae sp. FL2044]|nr:cytochrome P450 [Xylariomycetidae sp. FL2044]
MNSVTEYQSYLAGGVVLLGLLMILTVPLRDPLRSVPGPWYVKWTNLVVTYKSLRGEKPSYVHSLHKKYGHPGSVVRIGTRSVAVDDPAAAQQIYRIKDEFLKSDFYDQFLPGSFSVFTTRDRDYHARLRKLLSNGVSETSLARFIPQVDAKARLAIQRMGEEQEARGFADLFKWWFFYTTDVIGELSFGESFNMLELRKKNQYIEDLQAAGALTAIRSAFPLLFHLALNWVPVPIPAIQAAIKQMTRMTRYAEESMGRHYRWVEERGSDEGRPTLFSKMYKALADESLTRTEVTHNARTYIIAGSDTTSNTLTYLVWEVCRHPDIRAELLKVLSALPDDFTHEDLRDLPYLDHVIDETMRLYPSIPLGLPRDVPAAGATLGGYFIPGGGGITVESQAWSMHQNAVAFPEPERFDPSRWEGATREMKDSFVPFGRGSRVCIGRHLAKIELRLGVARFFTTYPNASISNLEGFDDRDMEQKQYFLASPKGKRCCIKLY